jgi:hypothetical protein
MLALNICLAQRDRTSIVKCVPPASDGSWKDDAERQVSHKSASIGLMLYEVNEVMKAIQRNANPTLWVDLTDDSQVALFALVPGFLHEVRGPVDDTQSSASAEGQPRTSECSYEMHSIIPGSDYSVRLHRSESERSETLRLDWTFRIASDKVITVRAEPVRGETAPKSLKFARALAAEIAKTRAGPTRA